MIISRDAREVIPPNVLPSSSIFAPDWSKGGSTVAFVNNSKIYTIDVDAAAPLSTLRTISTGTKGVESPTWSPDDSATPQNETDRFLVFGVFTPKTQIVRLDLTSGAKTILVEGKTDSPRNPDWRANPTSATAMAASLILKPSATSSAIDIPAAGQIIEQTPTSANSISDRQRNNEQNLVPLNLTGRVEFSPPTRPLLALVGTPKSKRPLAYDDIHGVDLDLTGKSLRNIVDELAAATVVSPNDESLIMPHGLDSWKK